MTFKLSLKFQFGSLSPIKCFLQPFILVCSCPFRTLSIDTLPVFLQEAVILFSREGKIKTGTHFKPQ